MARLFEVAAQIATPLGLTSIIVIVLFLVYRQLIRGPLAAQLSRSHSFHIINRIVTFVFVLGIVALILSIGAYLVGVVVQSRRASPMEEPRTAGLLSPGNAPMPATPCDPLQPGEFILLAGNNTGVRVSLVRRQTIVVMMKGEALLWVNYEKHGVYVSATLKREDGRLVAILRQNRFAINPNNYYELKLPSRHELTVLDKEGTRVLHAEFLNEQVFRITGHFVQPGYGALTIQADKVIFSSQGNSFQGGCLFDNSRAMFSG